VLGYLSLVPFLRFQRGLAAIVLRFADKTAVLDLCRVPTKICCLEVNLISDRY